MLIVPTNFEMVKNNNFDFLRFLFAFFVVISHSYDLSGNNESSTWINQISNGQFVFSQIGLSGFFVISGFFIFKSLNRSNSLLVYFKKRILRIFPALFVVLLVSILVVSFIYHGNIPFFRNKEVYSYFFNNFSLYKFQSGINGVFDMNQYHAINGSLWTIRYEFCLYIVLALLYFLKEKKTVITLLLFFTFIAFTGLYMFFMESLANSILFGFQGAFVFNLGTFFIAGSLLASLQFEKIKYKKLFLALGVLIFILSIHFNFYNTTKHLIFPILVLLIGFIPLPFFSTFGKIGDMSYGIYIYGFPIQQTLMWFFKMDTYTLMFTSLLLSTVFGYLSWHLIEKRALKYK